MIQELIDIALLNEQTEKLKRVTSGKFIPSNFGRCYRLQYWHRQREPITNPPDIQALRRFKIGNIIHSYIQQFFSQAQIEVKVDIEDVIGFADIVLSDEVIDIKSCRSYEFKLMDKKGYDIEVEKETNCLQVGTYAYFLNKPKARLIFVEKDALDSREFSLDMTKWTLRVAEELTILRTYWKKEKLPPPLPRAYNGKDCDYCPFMDKCKGGKDDIANTKE